MIFTKLLRPIFAHLREKGYQSVIYIDDSYLQGYSFEICKHNIEATVKLLLQLGFTINETKSVLVPTQELEFLGFKLNSINMTITLTDNRKHKILNVCNKLLNDICCCSSFIAALPGVKYGQLHYRAIEHDKNLALKKSKGKYNKSMTLSSSAQQDVTWWITNVLETQKFLHPSKVALTIYSDASLEGWGATDGDNMIGDTWAQTQDIPHINLLELYAAKLALQFFAKEASQL